MPSSPPPAPTLVRGVSRWQIVGLSINDVIGSGVYLLPAAAAALLGPSSAWAVVAAGVAVAFLVLCFAEAASYFDQPGAAFLYTRAAFGDFVGFEVGWMTWLARIASLASLANGLALACAYLWPDAASGWPRAAIIGVTLVALARVNVVGVTSGARTAVTLTVAKLVPLVFFILVGMWFVDGARLSAVPTPENASLGEAALLLLFAYAGFENTAAAAGEYRNPRRDIPFAMLTMIVVVTVIYTAVQVITMGTLPDVATAKAPLAQAAATFAGGAAATLLTLGAVVSIVGNLGNTTLMGPRYLFALAQNGYGPRALAEIHPRFRTPANAIALQTTIALALALSGSFVQLAMLSVIARLTTYIGTAAAVPVLRRKFAGAEGAIRLPGGPAIPVIAVAVSLAFLASATWRNLVAGACALVVGAVIYALRRRPPPGEGESAAVSTATTAP
jgi:APA family basic amino acid/polyamine antiporter